MQILALVLSAALVCAPPAARAQAEHAAFEFDARAAEHLLNRAGFGARPLEIEAVLREGQRACVARWLAPAAHADEPFFARRLSPRDAAGPPAARAGKLPRVAPSASAGTQPADSKSAEGNVILPDEPSSPGDSGTSDEPSMRSESDPRPQAEPVAAADARSPNAQRVRELRTEDRRQLAAYSAQWVERMLAGDDPLRERMTLFWHGHFTSSMQDVQSSYELIAQNRMLREHALGDLRALLRAVVRDPAMLEYLDNDANRKQAPNENFAREFLELFTLGEGNYSESDVKEVARAFTGWTDRAGTFRVVRRQQDRGEKTIFGQTGRFDPDGVIELVLQQPSCARHIASRILTHFEGRPPEPLRLAEYAAHFATHEHSIAALLEKLLLDPRFYRAEVVGARIASPLDYLVGSARRLGVRPPPQLIALAAAELGQRLFHPPSVQGWVGGEAWITTSTFMQRANVAGILCGALEASELVRPKLQAARERTRTSEPAMESAATQRAPRPEALASTQAAPDGSDAGAEQGDSASADETGAMEPLPDPSGANAPSSAERGLQADTSPSIAPRSELGRALERVEALAWRPQLNLSVRLERLGARSEEAVVDALASELLAVELGPDTRALLRSRWAHERESARGSAAANGPADPEAEHERALRALAHAILSLPEAHLH
jgi:uncharacterized protein (DUF1800 family)